MATAIPLVGRARHNPGTAATTDLMVDGFRGPGGPGRAGESTREAF